MGKVNCECGWQISDVCDGNKAYLVGGYVIDSDKEIKEMADIIMLGADVWECCKCGRIAIGYAKSNKLKWYRPEDNKPYGIKNSGDTEFKEEKVKDEYTSVL